jgi:hypothetical protein
LTASFESAVKPGEAVFRSVFSARLAIAQRYSLADVRQSKSPELMMWRSFFERDLILDIMCKDKIVDFFNLLHRPLHF